MSLNQLTFPSEPTARHIVRKFNLSHECGPLLLKSPCRTEASLVFSQQDSLQTCPVCEPSCPTEFAAVLFLCPRTRLGAPVLGQPHPEHLPSTHYQCRSTHQLAAESGLQVTSCFQNPLTTGPPHTWRYHALP